MYFESLIVCVLTLSISEQTIFVDHLLPVCRSSSIVQELKPAAFQSHFFLLPFHVKLFSKKKEKKKGKCLC